MEKAELIKQLVTKEIATQDEAEREYARFEKEAEKQFSFLSPEDRAERVQVMFTGYFRALEKTDLKTCEGIILKASGKEFITKRRIEKIMREYNEDPQKAIDEEKVKIEDGQPVAIESKRYWNEGKPNQRNNPNYGKKLDENSVQMSVEGIFMYGNEEKKFIMTLRDDFVYKLDVPLLTPLRMKVAIGNSIDSETIRLMPRRRSKFERIQGQEVDVLELVEKYYGDPMSIGDIPKVVAGASDSFSVKSVVKGQVLDPNLQPNEKGFGSFRLMEESIGFEGETHDCRVRVPETWINNMDFGEFSTVLVSGNPWVFTPENSDTPVAGITADGIYPVLKVKPSKTNGAKEEDVNGNGEIPKDAEEFNEFDKIDDKAFQN